MSTIDYTRSNLKDLTFLTIAKDLGALGTCDRGHVGALIVKDGRCVTWGYNGAPPGLPHCDENNHGWDYVDIDDYPSVCQFPEDVARRFGCRWSIHAEANAIAYAARQGISTEGGTCYVETCPCLECARLLIAAGIRRIVYQEEYRDPAGRVLLEGSGVEIQ
jgi:dCMP deaminase